MAQLPAFSMAIAKNLYARKFSAVFLGLVLLAPSAINLEPAQAAVTSGAAVVCDASNASNVSTTSCTNSGSSGTNITLNGSPSRTSRGQGSVGFNLTSLSQNQYGTGSMGSTAGVETVTVEMFLYLASDGNIYNYAGSMLFQFDTNTAAYNIYHFGHKLGFNTFTNEVYGFDATSLEDSWHHFVFIATTSATDSSQQIYVDGVKKSLSFVFGSSSNASKKVFNSNGNFTLMNHGYSANQWNAKGELGLLRVYKRELTAAEIQSNYAAEQWRMSTATSISSLALSNAPKKGLLTTITATVSNPGRVRFLLSGKRIAGCTSVPTTGSGPITATCTWKPATSGGFTLTASLAPSDSGLSASQSSPMSSVVGRRVTIR
jgi:hypothetical protein